MPARRASEIFKTYGRGVPVDVKRIAEELGIKVFGDLFLPYAGVAAIENGEKVIRYRATDSLVRQRFTIAHEIGHHELGHTQSGESYRDLNYVAGTDKRETDANAFAAELLIPKIILEMVLESDKVKSIQQLADSFQVSGAVMSYRLKNLGYLISE